MYVCMYVCMCVCVCVRVCMCVCGCSELYATQVQIVVCMSTEAGCRDVQGLVENRNRSNRKRSMKARLWKKRKEKRVSD
jgi:hypothetical protein